MRSIDELLAIAKQLDIKPTYEKDLEYFKPYLVLQHSINTCLSNGDEDGLKLVMDLIKYQRRHSKYINYKQMVEDVDRALNTMTQDLNTIKL